MNITDPALAIVLGLLAHLVGDYLIQSHWMSQEKTKRWWPAALHAVTYVLPFLVITRNPWALAVIVVTHGIIDRYRLARHVVWAKNHLAPFMEVDPDIAVGTYYRRNEAVNPSWAECKATGYPPDTPPWLAVWLMIVADNTLHLVIQSAVLWWAVTR